MRQRCLTARQSAGCRAGPCTVLYVVALIPIVGQSLLVVPSMAPGRFRGALQTLQFPADNASHWVPLLYIT